MVADVGSTLLRQFAYLPWHHRGGALMLRRYRSGTGLSSGKEAGLEALMVATPTICIALLDDHEVVRHGISARLRQESDLQITGVYATTDALMSALQSTTPDVLLIDYVLGADQLDGINLVRALRLRYPRCKILMSSSQHNTDTVLMAMRAGAHGFVGKEQNLTELVAAIRCVFAGKFYLCDRMVALISTRWLSTAQSPAVDERGSTERYSDLSPRESEVIRCYLAGLTVTQISQKFSRSIKTISGQKQSAFRKLGVRNDIDFFKLQHQLLFKIQN